MIQLPTDFDSSMLSLYKTALWGTPELAHCTLNFTLRELRQRDKEGGTNFKTGGLGPLMKPHIYEVWVCVEGHYCSNNNPTDKFFCWVIDERKARHGEVAPDQYVAWNHNAILQMVT